MKVVLVNHSDTRGGASVVTVRLLNALCRLGVDARMLVMHKAGDSPRIAQVGNALTRKAAFLGEHLDIFLHNGFTRRDLFKVSAAACGMPLHRHPWIKDADIVVLAWINQGMLSIKEIAKIQAPVVWTMHDMWCLTGICHHAGECTRYRQGCGLCPMLHRGAGKHDLSAGVFNAKNKLYNSKDIHFAPVSRWLGDKCADSPLTRDHDARVIANAFPVDDFSLTPTKPRAAYGLPDGKKLIVMGAARLDDPIKGLDYAVEALNDITDTDAAAVFFGALRDERALDNLRLPHVHLGTVSDPATLRDIYAHADCVLSTSHYETLPGTLIEGMAAGCVPVTFGEGGQADIVDHLSTGYIARYHDAGDVARGLRFAISGTVDRQRLRDTVTQRFSSDSIARKYLEFFNEILSRQ